MEKSWEGLEDGEKKGGGRGKKKKGEGRFFRGVMKGRGAGFELAKEFGMEGKSRSRYSLRPYR